MVDSVQLNQALAQQAAALLQVLPRQASGSALWRARQMMRMPLPFQVPVSMGSETVPVYLVNPSALKKRLRAEGGKDRQNLVEQLQNLAEPKRLVVPVRAHWDRLLDLRERLPNQRLWVEQVLNRVKLQIATQQPLKLSPTLLAGPPGNGKSYLLHQMAEVFDLPCLEIQLGGNADNLSLIGTSRHWSSAAPGKLALFLARSEVANPLVLLEEIDKSGLGQHGWTLDIVLMLLESENARRFEDKYVEVPIDMSFCSFLATANQTEHLPAPLLSRFQVCQVDAPQARQWSAILDLLYRDLRNRDGRAQLFADAMPSELQQEMLRGCASIRELRLRLEQGFDAALARFDSPEALQACGGHLLPTPPALLAPKQERRIGFI